MTTPNQPTPKSALTDEQLAAAYNSAGTYYLGHRAIADAAIAAHVAQQVPDEVHAVLSALHKIMSNHPTRTEWCSGQQHKYIDRDEVLGHIENALAAAPQGAIYG